MLARKLGVFYLQTHTDTQFRSLSSGLTLTYAIFRWCAVHPCQIHTEEEPSLGGAWATGAGRGARGMARLPAAVWLTLFKASHSVDGNDKWASKSIFRLPSYSKIQK